MYRSLSAHILPIVFLKMKAYRLLKLLFLIPLLCGCGQMGPLYLPDTPPPIHTEKEQPQPAEVNKDEPKESTPTQKH